MPANYRDVLKRKLSQAYNHANSGQLYLAELDIEFNEVHPELSELLQQAAIALEVAKRLCAQFAEQSWAMDEEKLSTFYKEV
jgi:hypothetical protein